MKNITVISKGGSTAQVFRDQLHALLGPRANITYYAGDHYLPESLKGDVTLVSSLPVLEAVRPLIADMDSVVMARRSINYHEAYKLFSIPEGTDVLFVNDMHSSAYEAVAMLQMLGVDHINYHMYYPGCEEYPELDIAVTPGERHLAPACAKRVIDIKPRLIDITTIVEVLARLGLLDQYEDMLSAHYVRDIISLIKDNVQIMRKGSRLQSQLQAIINAVHDGIVGTDERGRVSVFNPVAEEIFSLPAGAVLDKEVAANKELAVLLDGNRRDESEVFRSINDRHVVVSVTKIDYSNGESGNVYTLKDVSEIRRLEESARRKLKDENKLARYTFADIAGKSAAIAESIGAAKLMAGSEATILIEGESGTGKELVAQSIHNASARKNGPFIAVNFAAMTESLLESELFGYEPGAFTGAARSGQVGLFEAAHKGTIFLDEIGDAPLPFQVKLLRVLQERQIKRIGSSRVVPIDVRVISATNKNLKKLIERGCFRKDLYYRLNVLPVRLPPLRERREDIEMLAESVYKRLAGKKPGDFFAPILPYLREYSWPGNIRELHNVVEYLVNICPCGRPSPAMLPGEMRNVAAPSGAADADVVYEAVLRAGKTKKTVGRRSLAKLTGLPESRVRAALAALAVEDKIVVGKGRRGITPVSQ